MDPLAALDDLWDFAKVVLATTLTGSFFDRRAARRLRRTGDVRSDVDAALAAARALRAAYRTEVAGAGPDGLAVAALEDALDHAARTTSAVVAEAAHEYVRVGRRYSAHDPVLGAGAEEKAYDVLTAALVAERGAYR